MSPAVRYLTTVEHETGARAVIWKTATGLAAWYKSKHGPVRAEATNRPDLAHRLAVGARQLEFFHLRSLEEIARSKTKRP